MSKFQEVVDKVLFEMEEKVSEAYIRKGASKRIKRNVVPMKIWVRRCGRSNRGCYRTYYVASEKREYYTELAKRALKSGEFPKYLLYFNEVAPRFKQLKVKEAWQRKFLGDTFTNQFAHLSGWVFAYEQMINKKIRGAGRVVGSLYDPKTGTHSVVLSDGTKIESTFKLGRRGGFYLKSKISTQVEGKDGIKKEEFNSLIEGSIKVDEDTGVRNLHLSKVRNYTLDAFLGFMDFAQSKFRDISVVLEYDRGGQIKNFILSGFGENVELSSSDKAQIIQSLGEKLKNDKRLVGEISRSKSLSELVSSLVRRGLVAPTEPVYDTIVKILKNKGVKQLVFKSTSEKREYTFSQQVLHSVQLQRSVDNDYHKGFRKYRLPNIEY
jgi:hypothetical protein